MSGKPGSVHTPAPVEFGQHQDQVMGELQGTNQTKLEEMKAVNAI